MTAELLAWYKRAGRDLPWRRTVDPYAVWVSEVMLQQTQVATALPYYERWMARFPTASSLAEATEDDALAMWQGLGYYRRCRMLQEGVRKVLAQGWPASWDEWRALPGVGDYTAAAMASICLVEAVPVVDGNVERVFARVNASALVGSPRREAARAWAGSLISHEYPADFNQAMMELGATVCKPANPLCDMCPISSLCKAFQSGTTDRFPVPNPKPPIIEMEWPILVWIDSGEVALERVPEGEWWSGMYRFPRWVGIGESVGSVKHTVTRHRVTFRVHVREGGRLNDGSLWFPISDLETLPLPSAMRKVWALSHPTARSRTMS